MSTTHSLNLAQCLSQFVCNLPGQTMTETNDNKKTSAKRLIGKIGLVIGLIAIVFVIVFGMLASWVAAYGGSTELVRMYEVFSAPVFVFGILFLLGGLVALFLPEGLSKDGVWSMQTGPYHR